MTVRVRTHANPLRRFPGLESPAWSEVFSDPARPFALEIGSSKGEFLLEHARRRPEMNILGTEIRAPLVEELRVRIRAESLANAHVIWGNVTDRVEAFTPTGRIDEVFLLFPDPWPKKRHHKRRALSTGFLARLAPLMPPGARVHVKSDHFDLFRDMRDVAAGAGGFRLVDPVELPAKSDWEIHCLRTGRPYSSFCLERAATAGAGGAVT